MNIWTTIKTVKVDHSIGFVISEISMIVLIMMVFWCKIFVWNMGILGWYFKRFRRKKRRCMAVLEMCRCCAYKKQNFQNHVQVAFFYFFPIFSFLKRNHPGLTIKQCICKKLEQNDQYLSLKEAPSSIKWCVLKKDRWLTSSTARATILCDL